VPESFRGGRLSRICTTSAAILISVLLSGAPALAAPTVEVRKAEWWLAPMGIAKAQQISQGEGVIVGLVDTGVDSTHPDLAGRVLSGAGSGGGSLDGHGSTADDTHGTNMAGLIVGQGGGPTHMLGIAPKAKILPYAVPPVGGSREMAVGIRWLADHGAEVINVSNAHPGQANDDEISAVNYALSKDVVVVASAGNTPQTGVEVASPANIPGVIAVSGILKTGNFWSLSASGAQVVVAAPAEQLISTAPRAFDPSRYVVADGTSGASALVSGLVALIRSRYPDLDAANVINRVISTAKDNGKPGRDPYFGYGTVRMVTALTATVPSVTANPLGGAAAAANTTPAWTPVRTKPSVTPLMKILIIGIPLVLVILLVVFIVKAVTRPKARPGPANRVDGRW
jgi:type VII secretion-associated serine protease mycosin